MLDKSIFDTADKDGICLFQSDTNRQEHYLLVKMTSDNDKISFLTEHAMVVILGDEYFKDDNTEKDQ